MISGSLKVWNSLTGGRRGGNLAKFLAHAKDLKGDLGGATSTRNYEETTTRLYEVEKLGVRIRMDSVTGNTVVARS